jgi:phage replication-related protein YjqB (UPF0714/DUF867 family)
MKRALELPEGMPLVADIFPSVAALTERFGSQVYRILCLDRSQAIGDADRRPCRFYPEQVTIISPHGGFIEPGTSPIAAATAGKWFNLFDFQGLREERPEELHVTSTKFRHPLLSDLLQRSATAVSIHGMGDQGHKSIWLGGLNTVLKALVLQELRLAGFSVNPNSPLYRGVNPLNVVNLAVHRGVQLELSNELMAELFPGSRFDREKPVATSDGFRQLVKALQLAIGIWCRSAGKNKCRRKRCV